MKINNKIASFHDLQDKSVFITGGGSGIGSYLTQGFIQQGAKVSFVQRSDATEFCNQLEQEYGNRPLFLECDVSDISALQDTILYANKEQGTIECLINNAAIDNRHTLDNLSVEQWDDSLNINLRPHFFTAQTIAPLMKMNGGGSIINFSSIAYLMGNTGYPAYVAAKSAITGLTRALARELGEFNIRVNSLLPGWVMTERQKKLWITTEDLQEQLQRQCLKTPIEPEDIIASALFLASETSKMISGQALVVDGGVVATG